MKLSAPALIISFFSLLNTAQAATIADIQSSVSAYANTVSASSGNFYNEAFTSLASPITAPALSNAVTGNNLTTYAWTPDAHIPTGPSNAYIDLTFSSPIYNGVGADLVLFFAGNATTFQDGSFQHFSFSIGSPGGEIVQSAPLGVTSSTSYYDNNGQINNALSGITATNITQQQKLDLNLAFFASYAYIDLDTLGYNQQTALDTVRIYLGHSSMPALAGAGTIHVSPVPLPLSMVLFSSGLALLSFFGRKKNA